MRGRSAWLPFTLAVLTAATVAVPPPARAGAERVSPPSAVVHPGQSTTAQVTFATEATSCAEARSDEREIALDIVGEECGENRTVTLVVTTSPAIRPGQYPIEVRDPFGGRTFLLTVREAPPPTTTTVPPTTTAPAAPTTRPPTTVAPPTTRPPPPPTTTTPTVPPAVASAFTPLVPAEGASPPAEVLFLPFTSSAYDHCIPLSGPCRDPRADLVIAPATGVELQWRPTSSSAPRPTPVAAADDARLDAVGIATPEMASKDFALSMLDLRLSTGRLRSLKLTIAEGALVPRTSATRGLLAPAVSGLSLDAPDKGMSTWSPFDRPYLIDAGALTDVVPVVLLAPSDVGTNEVIYGVFADRKWGLGVDLIPLLTRRGPPFLARHPGGAVGISVPAPPGLDPAKAAPSVERPIDVESPERHSQLVLGTFGGSVALVVLTVAAMVWHSRREPEEGEELG